MNPLRRIPRLFWLTLLASFSTALTLFLWLPKDTTGQVVASVIISLLTIGGLGWAIQKWIAGTIEPYFHAYPARIKILYSVGCVVAGGWLTLNIPVAIPPTALNPLAPPLLLKLTYRIVTGVGIGAWLWVLGVIVAEKLSLPRKFESPSRLPSWGKYALLMALVWSVYLLAFYPGMMSADSMDQWGQVRSGVYNDHHPAFHTFLIWLVTRIAFTPASVAVAQIIALALVAGGWLSLFEKIGIQPWLIWTTAAIFALSPVNGTMVNTLWKDVPYSTAILGLTLVIAIVVHSKGEWISSLSSKIILGITAALVLLLRHDGLPVGVGTFGVLAALYPARWRGWLTSALICAFLYWGVRGPLYQWVGVQKSTVLAESSLSLWSMAAYARPGSEAERLIASFALFAPGWDCQSISRLGPDWRQTDLDQSIPFTQAIANLGQRAFKVLIYYYRCARSMEWIVWDPYGEVRNASHVEVLVDPNPFGLHHDSKIPVMRDWVARWVVVTSHNPNLNWFIWRPAFFLYLNLWVLMVLALRNRDLRSMAICAPILIQSIAFSLIFAAPNFRYHYAVYLVALISLPLLLSPPLQKASEEKILTTQDKSS